MHAAGLQDMGFPRDLVLAALKNCDNNQVSRRGFEVLQLRLCPLLQGEVMTVLTDPTQREALESSLVQEQEEDERATRRRRFNQDQQLWHRVAAQVQWPAVA